MPFSSLGLSSALLRACVSAGYKTPSAIQFAAIPAILKGLDLIGAAQTGSGKTAAYVLPVLQQFEGVPTTKPRIARVLVLVPTRELAVQVGETFRQLSAFLPHPPHLASALKVTTVFGGVSINPQMLGLRGGTDILVATPGRLLDLIHHNAVKIGGVATLILDEADRLLDLGFSDELTRICALLPQNRQSLFFSATFPHEVELFASALLRDPVRAILQDVPEQRPEIEQRAFLVDTGKRTQLLRQLIEENRWPRVLVFVATRHASDVVAEKLRRARIAAEPFHGDLSQGKRTQVLADFKASRVRVVIATDVASRGLHINELPAVVNFDLPRSAVDYLHRIGRTGRAGERGTAVSFVSAATEPHFTLIQKRHGFDVSLEQHASFAPQEIVPKAAPSTGGIKGKRPNKKDKLRELAAIPSEVSGNGD